MAIKEVIIKLLKNNDTSEFRKSKFDFHARFYIKLSQFIVTCSLLYVKKFSFRGGGGEENNVTNNALFLQHTRSLH